MGCVNSKIPVIVGNPNSGRNSLKSKANMTEPVTENKTSSLSMIPDWSLLPEELLHIVSTHLEDCFDVLHARSVCNSWRFAFPFHSSLIRPSYSLPAFAKFPKVSKDLCTLEKVPLFLFRAKVPSLPANVLTSQYFWRGMTTNVSVSEYFLGGIGRDQSEDQLELPSPIQCSIKVNIPTTEPTLMNMKDCQIIPLGHQYRMIGWDPESWTTKYGGVAFIAFNKERGDFVVLLNYTKVLLVLRSEEMRWKNVEKTSEASCTDLIAFKGRFYATFINWDVVVYDPYTLIGTPLMPSPPLRGTKRLVRSGEELFLVESVIDVMHFVCRVSILDEEAGKWVEVSDIGDCVFFIGHYGNVSCLAKELPSGCGLSGNSVVFTDMGSVTYAYKYRVDKGDEDDDDDEDLNVCWRYLRENRVNCLITNPMKTKNAKPLSTSPVLALRVEL